MDTLKRQIRAHFDALAPVRDDWARKNRVYHDEIESVCRDLVPDGARVLVLGCGTGSLLAALKPARGVGVDLSPAMIERARAKYPELEFHVGDAEELALEETFDYIVLSDLVGHLVDIQRCFEALRKVTAPESRILVSYYNFLWEPVLKAAELAGVKMPQRQQNWLGGGDLTNLLELTGFEVIRRAYRLLLPARVPLLSALANRVMSQLPGLRQLCLIKVLMARPPGRPSPSLPSVSVVIPTRNERGNIAGAIERTPRMGSRTELIFVDGGSTDGTAAEIEHRMTLHPDREIRLVHQGDGVGKGDAVRKGFEVATGDVLMILDADLTVPPEDLPRFLEALESGRGDFVNGSRLVYPMETQAMRLLNLAGNKFFAMCFSWLLDQRLKDTLCGTKVLRRRDYEKIKAGRAYFGDFDPFGDFDLLFGAARQNLKIVEIPIRYRERTYGETNIDRFRHGWLLLKMSAFAYRKLKIT